MSAKETAGRIFHFIGGLVLTIVGIILIIYEFSDKGTNLSFLPFALLFLGLGWIGLAFDKHRKAQKLAADKDVPAPPQDNPVPMAPDQNPAPPSVS